LADELLIRTREYLRPQFEDADSLDIIVRVYANLEGMANYLVRQDKVRNLGQLRAFSTGFCGRISSFDFVDVGVGKEGGAARKVRGMCPLCVHVMTGIDLHYPREPFILHFQHTPAARHCSLFRRRATLLTNIDTTHGESHSGRIFTHSSRSHGATVARNQIPFAVCASSDTKVTTAPGTKRTSATAHATGGRGRGIHMARDTARKSEISGRKQAGQTKRTFRRQRLQFEHLHRTGQYRQRGQWTKETHHGMKMTTTMMMMMMMMMAMTEKEMTTLH
jgi:hypothetical protein